MILSKKTVGCLEYVSFPDLGLNDVLAKVDTGAYSGAIHCTDIKVVRRGSDKRRILKYTPLGHPKLAQETDDFEEIHVRSSNGHRLKRFIITTRIVCKGKTYELKTGLSDRTEMKREALIGRRFLRENGFTVDVRKNQELDDEGEMTR